MSPIATRRERVAVAKACLRCGDTKPTTEFYKRAVATDGLTANCKDCLRNDRRARRKMTDADRAAELSALANRSTKPCRTCGIEKPRDQFRGRQASRDGLAPKCKPCEAVWHRAHYQANREAILKRGREWYAANAEAKNAASRAWYRANTEYAYTQSRAWIEANREWYTEFHRRRRACIAETTVGPIDLDALWTGICALCGDELDRTLSWPHRDSKSVDHIVPLARGGTHTQDNLQWAHLVCNQSKGATVSDSARVVV